MTWIDFTWDWPLWLSSKMISETPCRDWWNSLKSLPKAMRTRGNNRMMVFYTGSDTYSLAISICRGPAIAVEKTLVLQGGLHRSCLSL